MALGAYFSNFPPIHTSASGGWMRRVWLLSWMLLNSITPWFGAYLLVCPGTLIKSSHLTWSSFLCSRSSGSAIPPWGKGWNSWELVLHRCPEAPGWWQTRQDWLFPLKSSPEANSSSTGFKRERKREEERGEWGREKYWFERDIHWLPPTYNPTEPTTEVGDTYPWPGIRPTTLPSVGWHTNHWAAGQGRHFNVLLSNLQEPTVSQGESKKANTHLCKADIMRKTDPYNSNYCFLFGQCFKGYLCACKQSGRMWPK